MGTKGTLTKKFHEVVRDLTARDHWRAADNYFESLFVSGDPVLAAALAAGDAAGLPPVSVSPSQGKLLNLLAVSLQARRILEIGTLGGYSAIWLARALPADGRLITLEVDRRAAEVARANLAAAGLAAVADVRLGPAADTLQELASTGTQPFDLIFIDADKTGYRGYLDWSLRLSRPGTMIIADNVVQGGYVAEAGCTDPDVRGVREYLEQLARQEHVHSTVIQTVGGKHHDGFSVSIVGTGPAAEQAHTSQSKSLTGQAARESAS
ncbi:MAG: O-methyltransferase [Streptosporangiaceae bacterium]